MLHVEATPTIGFGSPRPRSQLHGALSVWGTITCRRLLWRSKGVDLNLTLRSYFLKQSATKDVLLTFTGKLEIQLLLCFAF